jgi:diacylglycerol kinase family enzyme
MADQTERICVISNKGSGRSSREAGAIDAAMAVLGARATLWRVDGRDLDDAGAQAVAQGFGAVVAAGGDGTIMSVAGAVAGSGQGKGTRFGVVPLGTFNYFARGLGIPEDPEGAARVVLAGHARPVSLGEVNGRLFLNNVSLGVYPAILRQREEVYRRWGRRRLAAHWSVAKTFLRLGRPLYLTVSTDGDASRVVTPLLFVARSAFQLGHFGLDGADCVAEGRMAVFVAPPAGRAGLFASAFRLVRGSTQEGRDFALTCADEVTISARSRHLTVACDGEKFRMRTPLRLSVRHGALDVFAPSESPPPEGSPEEQAP